MSLSMVNCYIYEGQSKIDFFISLNITEIFGEDIIEIKDHILKKIKRTFYKKDVCASLYSLHIWSIGLSDGFFYQYGFHI